MQSTYYQEHLPNLRRLWQCPQCSAKINTSRRGDNTPVRRAHQYQPDYDLNMNMSCDEHNVQAESSSEDGGILHEPLSSDSISLDRFAELLDIKLDQKLGSKIDTIKCTIEDKLDRLIGNLESKFVSITDALSSRLQQTSNEIVSIHTRLQNLELENEKLRSELALREPTDNSVTSLQDTIAELRSNLNERDQATLFTDIEISGVPEFDGESTHHIVTAVVAKLGTTLEERDVVDAVRAGPRRPVGQGTSQSRPRPIVVRLARRALRDEILKNAKVRRGVNTADLGLPSHEYKQLYLNERLTKLNRTLLGKVRENRKIMSWKYAWTKDGRVYARQNDDSKIYQFRSESDIDRIFSQHPKPTSK
ncbi:unnamed protein product [Plutella xylostella]|uniref:(diamondback moth) hypothetical protein n=1 Tax=Plutella xylostella TaxID=51655 RepID=A0A8S4G107_PLUXY|nr:unnamed protein product [Plutella xylostella]